MKKIVGLALVLNLFISSVACVASDAQDNQSLESSRTPSPGPRPHEREPFVKFQTTAMFKKLLFIGTAAYLVSKGKGVRADQGDDSTPSYRWAVSEQTGELSFIPSCELVKSMHTISTVSVAMAKVSIADFDKDVLTLCPKDFEKHLCATEFYK